MWSEEGGSLSLSCYITHARFPQQAWKRFLRAFNVDAPFDTVYCSDSIPCIQREVMLQCSAIWQEDEGRRGEEEQAERGSSLLTPTPSPHIPPQSPFYYIPLAPESWPIKRCERAPTRTIRTFYPIRIPRDLYILVGSRQAVKLQAVRDAFHFVFPYDHLHIASVKESHSGVPATGRRTQTVSGGKNRLAGIWEKEEVRMTMRAQRMSLDPHTRQPL